MLTGFLNFHDEFRKLFGNTYTLSEGVSNFSAPVRYARESKDNIAQVTREVYPQIALFDYSPELDPDWNDSFRKWYDALHEYDDNLAKYTKAYEYKEPLKFIMRYDVKVYVKNPAHRFIAQSHFFATFGQWGRFLFNKETVETVQFTDELGDEVPYAVSITEVPRTDGVFELNAEFVMKPFIAIRTPQEVDLLETLVVRLNQLDTFVIDTDETTETVPNGIVISADREQYTEDFTNQTSITVTHNLGREVAVVVLDTNGVEIEAEVDHISLNEITVTFGIALSGKILII